MAEATDGPASPLRRLYAGGRLAIASLLGLAVIALLPAPLGLPWRGAIGWVALVAIDLALTMIALRDSSPDRVRQRCRREDERSWVILVIVVVAATMSLGALAVLMRKGVDQPLPLLLRAAIATLAVMGSWLLTHITFALRYAHIYYGDRLGEDHGGLQFPGNEAPDFWDFVYYAFVIGMTCQVSDVQVTARLMRRLTLVHGVLAFFFNTGVLALAVNILAGIL